MLSAMIVASLVLGAQPVKAQPGRARPAKTAVKAPRDAGVVDAGVGEGPVSQTGEVDSEAGAVDAGPRDGRARDGGLSDAGARGAAAVEGGARDGKVRDGGARDAGALDGSAPDGGMRDRGGRDAGGLDGGPRIGGAAAFLFFPDPPNLADGTILPPADYEGPGMSVLKYAAQQFENRQRELDAGQKSLELANAALQRFFKTSGGDDPKVQSKELATLADRLEAGKTAFLAAADHEKKRLSWVGKIVREAREYGHQSALPDVDMELVEARQEAIREGLVRDAIELRFGGYRGLMMGIVAWVDGDTRLALERLKSGVAGTPDLPLAHLYLGYVYYILERVNEALAEWRKAQALEPNNPTIKKLIADHLHERK